MCDQVCYITPALLAHPDFQQGVQYGNEYFEEEYSDKSMTENSIARFLGELFSEPARQRNMLFARSLGMKGPSSFYSIGFAVSWLDKALAAMNC